MTLIVRTPGRQRKCSVCRVEGHSIRLHMPSTRPEALGIVCPYCGANDDQFVKDSRPLRSAPGILRRRECRVCDKRYRTIERVEADRAAYEEALRAVDMAVLYLKRTLGQG